MVSKIEPDVVYAKLDVNDKDWHKTKKLTWIAHDEDTNFEISLVEFDFLITKDKLLEEDKLENFINPRSKIEYTAIAEGALREVQKGSIIQLERRGFFYVD